MVHRTLKCCKKINARFIVAIVLLFGFFAAVTLVALNESKITEEQKPEEVTEEKSEAPEIEEPEESPLPVFLNLQPIVDDWQKTITSKNIGIEIYDLDNKKIAAELNPDEVFSTESLYKLFVVYEGYRRIEQGIDNPSDIVINGKTREQCLDLAIRESNSPCAESIRSQIGIKNLDEIISSDFELKNTSNEFLRSTASDITDMMKIYYEHQDLSEETWEKIKDSMLIQPPVNNGLCSGPCDWRQGLPSGFSVAKIYNKVGWRWDADRNTWASYHDTAIAVFESENRHYIITVLTSGASYRNIAKLGTMLENAILGQ